MSSYYIVHDGSLNTLSYLYLLNAVLVPVFLAMICEVFSLDLYSMQTVRGAITTAL